MARERLISLMGLIGPRTRRAAGIRSRDMFITGVDPAQNPSNKEAIFVKSPLNIMIARGGWFFFAYAIHEKIHFRNGSKN